MITRFHLYIDDPKVNTDAGPGYVGTVYNEDDIHRAIVQYARYYDLEWSEYSDGDEDSLGIIVRDEELDPRKEKVE